MKPNIIEPEYIEKSNSIPTLKKFALELEKLNSYDIFSLESNFAELSKGDLINELLQYELSKLASDELYFPSNSTYTFLSLLKSKYSNLTMIHSLNIDYTKLKGYTASSSDTMILSLTKRPIKYSLYKQNNPFPLEILDKTKTLELVANNLTLNYGDVLKLKEHVDVLVYNETGDEDILTLILVSTLESGILWDYDKDFKPYAIVSGNQDSSRLEHLCTMFGELGHESSLNSLEKLIENPYFNVRWAAAKAIMLINTDEGIKALEKLSKDDHPDVRESAIKHLIQVKTFLNLN